MPPPPPYVQTGFTKTNRERVIPTKIREGGNNSISAWVSRFNQTQQFQLSTKKPIKKEFFLLTRKKLINQRGKIAHSNTMLSFLFSLFYRTPKPSKGFSKQHYRAILFYTLQAVLSSFILLKCRGLCSRIMHPYLIAFPQKQLAKRTCMEINWYNLIPKNNTY
jgi:hypothetical protein